MKKFLPKSIRNPQGFTLIELLVVVSIIAILSVIGVAVFGQVQSKARDARRKSDIDSISKAYEVNYDPTISLPYKPLATTDFQSGSIPTPPEGGSYYNSIQSTNATTYTVCAALEGGTANCNAPSATCFCKSAAQGGGGTGVATCATSITNGANCRATVSSGTLSINQSVFFCPGSTIDCNIAAGNAALYTGNYYSAASGGNPVNNGATPPVNVTVNVYRNGVVGVTGTTVVNAQPRTTNP